MSPARSPLDVRRGGEVVEHFDDFGITAFTTGRAAGRVGTQSAEPVREVMARWGAVRALVGGQSSRLATATQRPRRGRTIRRRSLGTRARPSRTRAVPRG